MSIGEIMKKILIFKVCLLCKEKVCSVEKIKMIRKSGSEFVFNES